MVNHNGTYFLTSLDHKPEIKLYLENRRAYYTIDLPWHMLKPFHPLLHKTMGINIRYNSQNDDGSKKMLQLLEDEHFDSESKVEKQYIPVHFSLSEKSELQFAFEMEDNTHFGEHLHLDWIGIHPDVRRRGVGRFLMLLLMERAVREGFQTMGLSCDAENTRAIALYRSLGWQQEDAELKYATKL